MVFVPAEFFYYKNIPAKDPSKTIPCQQISGAKDLFKTKKFKHGCLNFFFFCRDENQNSPKLHGRNAYLSLFNIGQFYGACTRPGSSLALSVIFIVMRWYESPLSNKLKLTAKIWVGPWIRFHVLTMFTKSITIIKRNQQIHVPQTLSCISENPHVRLHDVTRYW